MTQIIRLLLESTKMFLDSFKKKETIWLLVIIFIGAFYRLVGLGQYPLWIDETLFYEMITDGHKLTQELVSVNIYRIIHPILGFDLKSEFSLRLLSSLSGILTIASIYSLFKHKKLALILAAFFAIFPLFVFWSRMARPYALAGLLMTIGWRYTVLSWFQLLENPITILGLNFKKINWRYTIGLISLAFLVFMLREDRSRGFDVKFFLTSSRMWYLPLLALILNIGEYYDSKLDKKA